MSNRIRVDLGHTYRYLDDLTDEEFENLLTEVNMEKVNRKQNRIQQIDIMITKISFKYLNNLGSSTLYDITPAKEYFKEARFADEIVITWQDDSQVGIVDYFRKYFLKRIPTEYFIRSNLESSMTIAKVIKA